jgi:hypothetical protein
MENILSSMFSGICKLYTKFCEPPVKGYRMSDDLLIKHKKEDDYLGSNTSASRGSSFGSIEIYE